MPTANGQTTDRAFLATISVRCLQRLAGNHVAIVLEFRNTRHDETRDFGRPMSPPSSCHDERAASASCRDLLELAATLARRAATAVMDIRARGITINRKPDASPVTAADRAADELIVSGLRAATPDMPVISEEFLIGRRGLPRSARNAAGWSIRWTAPRNSVPGWTSSRSTSGW